MSVREVLGTKRCWIAAALMAAVALCGCAAGAALQQRGALPQDAGGGWMCAVCLGAGSAGGWVAAAGKKGSVLMSAAAALITAVLTVPTAAIATGGVMWSSQSARCMGALLTGAVLAGLIKASRQGRRRAIRPRRRPMKRAARR